MHRRDFLSGVVGTGVVPLVATAARPTDDPAPATPRLKALIRLEPFDYRGVKLLPGRLADQVAKTRETYFNLPDDNLLKGFRRDAGLPAPGEDMGGWCRKNCDATFGQWLSGMARMSLALGDAPLRDKAIGLAAEWGKTLGPGGRVRTGTYGWEKMVCGLTDLSLYAGDGNALPLLERTLPEVSRRFDRSRSPATALDRDGRRPKGTLEWYTLPENLYRAYLAGGSPALKEFADLWRYESYWGKFAETNRPTGVEFLHSYSHVNSFASAAMSYAVTGDERYLTCLRNGYDYITQTQCYASGGYGPGEWSVPIDGTLGNALEIRSDSCEIGCGSWAAFKLARYLTMFTGEARGADWVESLIYNGVGAGLPVQPDGRTTYYADYRLGTATKLYHWDQWPCCGGSYIQAIADYLNQIYYRDSTGLHVSLFVPSEATWRHAGAEVTVRQETSYPEGETATFTVKVERPTPLALRFRVPQWSDGLSATVNGTAVTLAAKGGEWAVIDRTWNPGDQATVTIPTRLRFVPVDPQHPRRVALMFGPVMLAQEARFTIPLGARPGENDPGALLVREGSDLRFRARGKIDNEQQVGPFYPFYDVPERIPYRVYLDLDSPRFL